MSSKKTKKIKTVAISALAHPASHGLLVHLALANAAPARPPRRPIVRASWPDAPAATGPSCSALGELESPNDPLEPHTYHTVRVEMSRAVCVAREWGKGCARVRANAAQSQGEIGVGAGEGLHAKRPVGGARACHLGCARRRPKCSTVADAPRAQVSATTCGKRKGSSAGTGERSNERAGVLGLKGRARGEIWAHVAQRRPKK